MGLQKPGQKRKNEGSGDMGTVGGFDGSGVLGSDCWRWSPGGWGGDPDRWGPVDQLGLVEGYSYWSSAYVGQWRREDRVLEERSQKTERQA